MDITLNKKTTTNASIKVTVNEADYQSKVEEKLKDYSKKAQIKGFRPGKVPPTLIKKMYGKSILVEEINHLLSDSINKYIKEKELPIVGEPLPNNENQENIDWENQKAFEFVYTIGMHSDFNYDLKKLDPQVKHVIKVDDKEIDETIERIQSQSGKMDSVETSEKGDFIYGDLKAKSAETVQPITLPSNKVVETEQKKFVGLTKGKTVEFDIKKIFGGDSTLVATFLGISKDEAEKLEGAYELTVTDIKRTIPGELNQDLFDRVFGKDVVKTEEEFRSKIKETLQTNFDAESDSLLTKNIYESLIETTQIELPEDFIKDYLFILNQGKFTKEQIEKDYPLYSKEIKWGLIRNKIIKELEYKVTDNELKEEARKIMKQRLMQYGGGEMPEMGDLLNTLADNYLKQDNGKNVNGLIENILFNKTIDFVKEKVTIKEKEISKEEFTKLASN